MTATFTYVTANLQGTDTTAQIKQTAAGVVKASGADVIGWQEGPTGRTTEILNSLGTQWAYSLCTEVPISWRSDLFKQVGEATKTRVHGGELNITPTRYVHTVVLEHIETGDRVAIVNTHVVHHIEAGGLPRKYKGDPTKKGTEAYRFRDQLARAKKHFAILAEAIQTARETVGAVVWGGDLNVSFYADRTKFTAGKACSWFPYAVLSPVTKFDPALDGTEGGRMIDWLGHAGAVDTIAIRKLPKVNSDHNPVAAEYKLTYAPKPHVRGSHVEAAIAELKLATPTGENKARVAKALEILESI